MRRKKPGPKGLLKNPCPVKWTDDEGQPIPGPTEVAGHELDDAERQLRKYFREHRGQLVVQAGEPSASAVSRLTKLAAEALAETQAAWWSGYAVDRVLDNPAAFRSWNSSILIPVSLPWGRGGGQRRHVGPVPPAKVEHKCLWIDTSTRSAQLKQYDKHARSWQVSMEISGAIAGDKITAGTLLANLKRRTPWRLETKWPRLVLGLREPVTRMLQGKMGRAGKSGRPAYLACATLAALLDVSPRKVTDILANHRRRRPKP